MRKRTLIAVFGIAAVVVAFWLFRRYQNSRAAISAQYQTVAAREDTIVATVSASGSLLPRQQVTLNLMSTGLLDAVSVVAGQKVEKGQELARLDTRQLEASVAQAEAALKISEARLAQTKAGTSAADLVAAEAAVDSAQALYESAKTTLGLRGDQLTIAEADLKKAEIALRDAQGAYDRVAALPQIGMLPQSAALERATIDYQRASANYKLQVAGLNDSSLKGAVSQLAQAKAQLDRLQRAPTPEDLTIAEAQVEQSSASLEQAKLRLADAILIAPFSGTVLSVDAEAGDLVAASSPMMVLGDLGSFHVDATIDETDIGRVQIGQDAAVTLDAFPDSTFVGKVTRLDLSGKSVQGVVSYALEIELAPTEEALRSGMTATANITVARKLGLVVPNRAIKRDTVGKYYVEVLAGDQAQKRFVTPGLSNELVTEILSGVNAGDQVIVTAPRAGLLESVGGGSPFGFGGSSR